MKVFADFKLWTLTLLEDLSRSWNRYFSVGVHTERLVAFATILSKKSSFVQSRNFGRGLLQRIKESRVFEEASDFLGIASPFETSIGTWDFLAFLAVNTGNEKQRVGRAPSYALTRRRQHVRRCRPTPPRALYTFERSSLHDGGFVGSSLQSQSPAGTCRFHRRTYGAYLPGLDTLTRAQLTQKISLMQTLSRHTYRLVDSTRIDTLRPTQIRPFYLVRSLRQSVGVSNPPMAEGPKQTGRRS